MIKLLSTFAFLFSTQVFADTQSLVCQKVPGMTNGAFGIRFLSSDATRKTNYLVVDYASWAFSYSTAQLICSKDTVKIIGKEAFRCIGYVSVGGQIEVTINLENGTGTAKVQIIGNNIYKFQTDGMTLPCQITKE